MGRRDAGGTGAGGTAGQERDARGVDGFLTPPVRPLTPPAANPWEDDLGNPTAMNDVVFLAISGGFFALAFLYANFCERL